jgi:hypothetical protein
MPTPIWRTSRKQDVKPANLAVESTLRLDTGNVLSAGSTLRSNADMYTCNRTAVAVGYRQHVCSETNVEGE